MLRARRKYVVKRAGNVYYFNPSQAFHAEIILANQLLARQDARSPKSVKRVKDIKFLVHPQSLLNKTEKINFYSRYSKKVDNVTVRLILRKLNIRGSLRIKVFAAWRELFLGSKVDMGEMVHNIFSKDKTVRAVALRNFGPLVNVIGEKLALSFIKNYFYVRGKVESRACREIDKVMGRDWMFHLSYTI